MVKRETRLIAVVGSKQTGKTKLACYLVRRLTRKGFVVTSIKHVHHRGFTMDTPGKDSWRHTKAGARSVVVTSPNEIAQITKLPPGGVKHRFALAVRTALRMRPDFVVIEGFASSLRGNSRRARIILMAKGENDLNGSLRRLNGKVAAISGLIAERKRAASYMGIPIVRFPAGADKILSIAID